MYQNIKMNSENELQNTENIKHNNTMKTYNFNTILMMLAPFHSNHNTRTRIPPRIKDIHTFSVFVHDINRVVIMHEMRDNNL